MTTNSESSGPGTIKIGATVWIISGEHIGRRAVVEQVGADGIAARLLQFGVKGSSRVLVDLPFGAFRTASGERPDSRGFGRDPDLAGRGLGADRDHGMAGLLRRDAHRAQVAARANLDPIVTEAVGRELRDRLDEVVHLALPVRITCLLDTLREASGRSDHDR